MNFDLPKTVTIAGKVREIRWEYRDILNILQALSDPDLSDKDKTAATLCIFYPEADCIEWTDYSEALERAAWFIDGGGETPQKGGPRLMDWEQDFPWIIAPINRVLGRDVREEKPLHWWSFLSAYYEIGDCTFAQIVRIRDMIAKGKRLEKAEREWARRNADLITLKHKYGDEENDLLKAWMKGGGTDAGN